jgi:plastocyanin domain-containing protein
VIAKDLFDGEIRLTPGRTSRREFTVDKPGRYKFSCWMGMVTGVMNVVE